MPIETPNTSRHDSQNPYVPRHDPLLTLEVIFKTPVHKTSIYRTSVQSVAQSILVNALIDSVASAPVMSPELAELLGFTEKTHLTRMT